MKYKNIILCAIISLIVILCSGCATIQHTRKVANGQVQDAILVQLDKSKFSSDQQYLEVANEIKEDFDTYKDAIDDWFEQFHPSGEEGDYELYENVKNNIIIVHNNDVSNGKFYFEITFLSIGYFYLFYGVEIEGVNKDQAYEAIMNDIGPFLINYENLKVEDFSAFSYKYSRTASDSIYSTIVNQMVIDGNSTYLEKYAEIMGMESENAEKELLENIDILQVFGTVDDRICSNANDGKEKGSDGLYYHFWDVNQLLSDDESGKIEIFLRTANQATWYILALVLAVVALAIAYVMAKKVNLSDIDKALTLDCGDNKDEEE